MCRVLLLSLLALLLPGDHSSYSSAFVAPSGACFSSKVFIKKSPLFSTASADTSNELKLNSLLASSEKKVSSRQNDKQSSSLRAPSANQEQLEEKYRNFPRTWVPLGSTLELDPKKPNRLEFLENSYVAFRSDKASGQQWVVMDNTCPHRLAPLSEGRVKPETGMLQCSYHGWTFESDGSCQRIPQAVASVEQSALKNPRSCVASYSTFVDPETGMLWMWPWKEDQLQFAGDVWRHPEGIMGKDPRKIQSVDKNQTVAEGLVTYSREVPYGWDTLVENLIDPSHIPFAHHGIQGNRNDAIPINMTRANDRGAAGFSFEWEDRTMGMKRRGVGEFRAPYLVSYDAMFDTKDENSSPRPFQLSVLCIPTKPGWSRVITYTSAPPKAKAEEGDGIETVDDKAISQQKRKNKKTSIMRTILKMLPPWVTHLFSNKFFDSDLAFLHYQEQRKQNNKDRADYDYFMPAECDRSIVALYEWMQKHASSYTKNQSSKLPPALYDRSQLFDRWGQHTAQCKVCLDALAGIKKWRKASQVALALSILLGFRFWLPRFTAVACLGVLKTLNQLEGAFKHGEFDHSQNH